MSTSRLNRDEKGRRLAALLCVWGVCALSLAGCAQFNANDHPLISTLTAFVPSFGERDVSGQAQQISYASIQLTLSGRGGLLVLAQQQPGVTYWQSSQAETVVLNRGYLDSTAGLEANLQMTQFQGLSPQPTLATPFPGDLSDVRHYRITRRWQPRSDDQRAVTRSADGVLSCESQTESVKLPLATLPLVECHEVLSWDGGGQSASTFWIDPKDNRIWKARTQPWPGAPEFDWAVARPWW